MKRVVILVVIALLLSGCGSSIEEMDSTEIANESSDADEAEDISSNEEISECDEEKTFVGDIQEFLDNESAEKLNDILVNQIGFDNVDFKEKLGETTNYMITADGREIIVTEIDGDFRIFSSGTDTVFYDDGKVLTTKQKLDETTVYASEGVTYYFIAKEIISQCLKNPNSADFPSQSEILFQKNSDLIAVKGYVDAQNSFGAEIRSDWIAQFYITDLDNLLYEVTYVNIDGDETGEFIEME